jgi:hypothetical protein
MDRSRCTAILKRIQTKNLQVWESLFTSRWEWTYTSLGFVLLILYHFAIMVVLLFAAAGGEYCFGTMMVEDPSLLQEYGWLHPVYAFALHLVLYTWGALLVGIAASYVLAATTMFWREIRDRRAGP